MGKNLIFYLLSSLIFLSSFGFASTKEGEKPGSDYRSWTTADHSKIPLLQQDFEKPEDVTSACIFCHTNASKQLHKTIHWTWECGADKTGKMGKGGITLNNF
jgi:hypothetical protein